MISSSKSFIRTHTITKVTSKGKALFLVVLFLIAALAGLLIRKNGLPLEFRGCGHQKSFFDQLRSNVPNWILPRTMHHCASSQLLNDLNNVAFAERLFFNEHARPSTNLVELQTDGIMPFTPIFLGRMVYQTEGTNWTITVAKTSLLAGFYLVTPDGTIFFNENQPARRTNVRLIKKDRFWSQ